MDPSFILIALVAAKAWRESWPLLCDLAAGTLPARLTLLGRRLLSC